MAQLVISAAGAAIGSAFGPVGAQLGWAAGSVLGTVLFPGKGPQGPQLSDLKVSGSAYGTPIPYVEGHPRVPCQVIWASDKYAVSSTSGGKGGPSVETTSTIYKVDLLALLTANQIGGVRRIWSNGALVWTASADATGDSLYASSLTDHWDAITVYGGDTAQLPDPIYEAAVGTGNAPAYRTRGTAMIQGLNLGTSGVLPNLTFEVVPIGSDSGYTSAIMYAPLTTGDYLDTISPVASNTVFQPTGLSLSASGLTLDATIPASNVSINYSHSKLYCSAVPYPYAGLRLVASVRATMTLKSGGSTDQERFFSYNTGPQEAAFSTQQISGAVHIVSWYYAGGSSTVDHGVAPTSEALYEIVFNADGTTVEWWLDGVLLRSANAGGRWNGYIYLSKIYSSGTRVQAITFRELQFYTGESPFTTTIYTADDAPLDDVVDRLCLRAGLSSGQLDATALSALSVRSMAVGQVTSTRNVLDMLAGAYRFDGVESAGKLKFVLRGGASAATIAYASMGASASGEPTEPLPLTMLNDIEAPAQVTVRYVNVSNDYQDGAESSDRLLGTSLAVQMLDVPIGFTPQEARALADIQVMDVAASQRTFGPVALNNDQAALEPTDVVTLTDVDGSTYRARILKLSRSGGVQVIDGVIEDASILTSVIPTTTTGYDDSNTVSGVADTVMELLDIPLLRDADDAPGFYAAFKGDGTPWPGCALYASADDVTYTQIDTVADSTQIGICTTTLGTWTGGTVFDEKNSVTVDIGDQTLQNWSREDILSGAATGYVIGSELIYARTATLQSAGIYKLTGLLRGRRGTEWAIAGHAASERFVALAASGRGLRRVTLATGDIGVLRYYKAVTAGRALSTATAQTLACASVGQIPFAPVDLRASVLDSAVQVAWKRRTRYATRFTGAGGISVPLGELSEAYTTELRDGSDALVGTETLTEPLWTSGGMIETGSVVAPVWGIATISSEMVAVRDDQLGTFTTPKYLARYDSTGALIAQSPLLGAEIHQWCADGDELYAACATFNTGGVPVTYLASTVKRLTRTSIGTVAATYTAATAGDIQGIAHDGSNVWVSEFYGGNLRKLDETTLVSAATYALDVGIAAMQYLSGDLWVVATASDEVIQWDISGTSETQRFSVLPGPFDLLLDSSLVYVLSSYGLGVYNQSDGSLVASHALVPAVNLAQRCMCKFGTYIAVTDVTTYPQVVALFNAATGAFVRNVDPRHTFLYAVSGVFAGDLYLVTGSAEVSAATGAYELQPAGLSGYSLTVAQRGALGDGYTATIDL